MSKKKTVGQVSSELLQSQLDSPSTHTIEEQGEAQTKDYLDNLILAVNAETKRNPSADFFVVVITKKEPLMQNVLRNYFFTRTSCPTPDYDQAVYHYQHHDGTLQFKWVIPARDVCHYFLEHPAHAENEAEKQLVGFIHDFADKTLAQLQMKLNGKEEKIISTVLH